MDGNAQTSTNQRWWGMSDEMRLLQVKSKALKAKMESELIHEALKTGVSIFLQNRICPAKSLAPALTKEGGDD